MEFALLAPLLFLLLLGMITGGLTLSQKNSLENGTREAVRFGAVNPVTAGAEHDFLAEVIDAAVDASTGELDLTDSEHSVCAAYVNDDGDIFRTVEDSGGPADDTGTLCFSDGRTEARVQVVAERKGEIELLVSTIRPTLRAQAVTRYER